MLHLNQYRDIHLAHLGLVWLYLIYYWATSRLRPPLTYVSLTLIYMSSLSELNVLPQGSTPHPPSGTSRPSLSCISSFTALHLIPHWAIYHPHWATSRPTCHTSLSYISSPICCILFLIELHLVRYCVPVPHWAPCHPSRIYTSSPLSSISSFSELHLDHHRPTCHTSLSCISSFTALHPIPHWNTSHPQLAASYPLLSNISSPTDLSITELHLIITKLKDLHVILSEQHLISHWATSRPPSNYDLHVIPELHLIPHRSTPRPPSHWPSCHPSLSCISSFTALHLIPHWAIFHPHWATSHLQLAASHPLLSELHLVRHWPIPHWGTSHHHLAAYYFTDHDYVDFLTRGKSSFAFLYIMFYKVPYMCILLDWGLEI
jgi:hypothetical protein